MGNNHNGVATGWALASGKVQERGVGSVALQRLGRGSKVCLTQRGQGPR
jgi:hypothetical protein